MVCLEFKLPLLIMVIIFSKCIKYKHNNRLIPHNYSQWDSFMSYLWEAFYFIYILDARYLWKTEQWMSSIFLLLYSCVCNYLLFCIWYLKELEREEKIAEREGWQLTMWQLSDEGSCLETVCESHFFKEGLSTNLPLHLSCLLHHPNTICEEQVCSTDLLKKKN